MPREHQPVAYLGAAVPQEAARLLQQKELRCLIWRSSAAARCWVPCAQQQLPGPPVAVARMQA
jgi:hypothetical protein